MPAKIIVTGRMTRDVEKTSEKAPYKFGVAVDGLVREGDEYKTKFFNVTVWDVRDDGYGGTPALDLIKRMEAKDKTLTKGSMVEVTGVPFYDVVTKDGVTTIYDGIKATDIDFVSVGQSSEKQAESKADDAGTNEGQDQIALDDDGDDEEVPLL